MRLAGQEKAGYYPTPPELLTPITNWIAPAPSAAGPRLQYRILDPCAGEGEALYRLAARYEGLVFPFAIELDHDRATRLQIRTMNFGLGRSLAADAFDSLVEPESMALLYLNPPYDSAYEVQGVRRQRTELLFLKQFTPTLLAPGGILVYVIPHSLLRNAATTKYLAAHYERFMVARFNAANGIFRQVVVYAVRKAAPDPDIPTANRLAALGSVDWMFLPDITEVRVPVDADGQPPYRMVPVSAMTNIKIQDDPITEATLIKGAGAETSSMIEGASAQAPSSESTADNEDDPAPNNTYHDDGAAAPILFRRISLEPEEVAARALPVHLQHMAAATQIIGRQDIRTATPPRAGHISMLIPAGVTNGTKLTLLDEDEQPVAALLKGRLRRVQEVSQREDDVSTDEKRKVAIRTIHTDRIRSEVVLLDAHGEAHVVAPHEMAGFLDAHMQPLVEELNVRMRPYYDFRSMNGFEQRIRGLNPHRQIPNTKKRGLMVAQQHAVAAAATVLNHEKAAVIVGEMGTGKTLLGTGVAAALNAKGRFTRGVVVCPPHLVGKWLEEIRITWPDCQAMKIEKASDVEALYRHPGPVLGVVKNTTLSLGPGWDHAFDLTGPAVLKTRTEKEPFEFVRKPKPWVLAQRSDDVAKHTMTASTYRKPDPDGLGPGLFLDYRDRRGIRCPVCGTKQEHGLADFRRKRLFCHACGTGLFHYTSETRRWPLSRVFKRAAKRYGKLDLFIADEVHQYKGNDSDRGYAFGHLCDASTKVLALTGTLFGGKASTIFWLLYRMMPRFRRLFTNEGATGMRRIQDGQFLKEYGLLETTETVIATDGKTSGNAKATTTSKEIPGLVPSLINLLLPYCVFINLSDLGYALPPYSEKRVAVQLPSDMKVEYDRVLGELYAAVSQALATNDKGLLGIYLSILMTWPEIPSRQRSAYTREGQHIVTTREFSAGPLTPKESAIVAHIKDSLSHHRRVMLFCEMTLKTDITPRWKDILHIEGISCAVCNADPDKRLEWFNRERDKGTQVILVHPKRVELGLDLYAWPEVIWMHEHTYSSYLVLQASRRAWRIGQKEPVNVTFYYYADTLQEQGLAATQQKAMAHIRVNGGIIDDDTMLDDNIDSMEQMLGQLLVTQVELQRKLAHARLYRESVQSGVRHGPTADSFPELKGLPDEELAAELDRLIAGLEDELEALKPTSTLDTLFAQKTALIDGIRTSQTATYAGLDDAGKYFELDEEPDLLEKVIERMAVPVNGNGAVSATSTVLDTQEPSVLTDLTDAIEQEEARLADDSLQSGRHILIREIPLHGANGSTSALCLYRVEGESANILSDVLADTGYGSDRQGLLDNGDLWVELTAEEMDQVMEYLTDNGYLYTVERETPPAEAEVIAAAEKEVRQAVARQLQSGRGGLIPTVTEQQALVAERVAERLTEKNEQAGTAEAVQDGAVPEDDPVANEPEAIVESTPEPPAGQAQKPVASGRVYPTWSDYYDLLAARAVTPERIAKLRKAGKPITRAYTITEDANLGMPRGYYLPVYSDDSLWLYLLRPKGVGVASSTDDEGENDPVRAIVVGAEVYLPEKLHSTQVIQDERWKVVVA